MDVVIVYRNLVHPHSDGGELVMELSDAEEYARKNEPFLGAWLLVPARTDGAILTPTARDMDHFANR